MQEYLNLLAHTLKTGVRTKNRTGIDTFMIPGAMMKFDLREGFPAVTTKKLAFGGVKGEILGFLRGYTNAADFAALGCHWWFQNANENTEWLASVHRKGEDDLGRVYGAQWTDWPGELVSQDDSDVPESQRSPYRCLPGTPDEQGLYMHRIDQVAQSLQTIRNQPTSRRILITGWNPAELTRMALPPCPVLFQFLADPERRLLHLCLYQRSCDMFLGVPMNIAGGALLLALFARLTDYTPATFTHFLADVHIYENHVEQVQQQLGRTPRPAPALWLDPAITPQTDIRSIEPAQIALQGYRSDGPLRAPMAV